MENCWLYRWHRTKVPVWRNMLPAAQLDFTITCDGDVGPFLENLSESSENPTLFVIRNGKTLLSIIHIGKIVLNLHPCQKSLSMSEKFGIYEGKII